MAVWLGLMACSERARLLPGSPCRHCRRAWLGARDHDAVAERHCPREGATSDEHGGHAVCRSWGQQVDGGLLVETFVGRPSLAGMSYGSTPRPRTMARRLRNGWRTGQRLMRVTHDRNEEGPHDIGKACSEVFADSFRDVSTWQPWLAFLAALFGQPMTPEQLAIYQQCTGRVDPPTTPASEGWLVCGRRSGKSFAMALCAVYLGCFREYRPYLQPD